MGYKKRKLAIVLPSIIYEEIRQIALGTNWTEEEVLVWSLEFGIGEIENADDIEKRINDLLSRKNHLDKELEDVTKNYVKLSTRNAALRYECYESFSANRTRSIKLAGARAKNGSYKKALGVEYDSNEHEDKNDNAVIEKYVLKENIEGEKSL